MLFCKLNSLLEAFRRVSVISKNESAIHPNAMTSQVCERLLKTTAHRVETFVHVLQVGRVETLKTNEHSLAAAADQQVQKLLIVGGIDTGLADPTNAKWNQRAEKLLRFAEVGRNV